MTASPRRRRNRTIGAALAGVLVLVAAPLLGYAGWQVLKDSRAGTQVVTLDEIEFPSTPTAMLAVVDDDNVVVSLGVLVMAPSPATGVAAIGGTLVSIPTNSNTAQMLGSPAVPIADSIVNTGDSGLTGDLESLTRVSIGFDAVLNAEELDALLTRVGPISATLPNDVVTVNADGATETLFAAGERTLSPSEAASVLLARDPGQTESRRLPNVQAVWNGLSNAVGTGRAPAAPLDTAIIDINDFFDHFLAGPVQVFNDLTTTPVVADANPDDLDVGTMNVSSAVLLMASLAPSAMLTPNGGLSLRIENGLTQADIDAAGLVGVTPADVTRNVVDLVLFLTGDVVSVSASVFTPDPAVVPDETAVYTSVELQPVEQEDFAKVLGPVTFDEPRFVFPLVGAVIVIGHSYLAEMAAGQAAQTATSDPDAAGEGADTEITGISVVDPTDTVSS